MSTAARGWALALLLGAASPATGQRIVVVSDLNGSYGSTAYDEPVTRALQRVVALRPDLVLSTGDMVAGQRTPLLPGPRIDAMWAAFHATVSDPLRAAGIPFAVTPGNHDASGYERYAAERIAYAEQWRPRTTGLRFVDRAEYPYHYAIALGDVLLISLDVTTLGPLDRAQRDWLERLLATHGPRFRHRIVFSHVPILAFTHGREREVSGDLALEALLVRHGVDLYLSGHHHAYYPGWHGGLRYVSQACLGSGPRALIGRSDASPRAITVLDIGPDGIDVRALTGPDFDRTLDLSTLPATIRSRSGLLVRDDLRPEAKAPGPVPASDEAPWW